MPKYMWEHIKAQIKCCYVCKYMCRPKKAQKSTLCGQIYVVADKRTQLSAFTHV